MEPRTGVSGCCVAAGARAVGLCGGHEVQRIPSGCERLRLAVCNGPRTLVPPLGLLDRPSHEPAAALLSVVWRPGASRSRKGPPATAGRPVRPRASDALGGVAEEDLRVIGLDELHGEEGGEAHAAIADCLACAWEDSTDALT